MNSGTQLLLDFLRSAWSMLAGTMLLVGLVGLFSRILSGMASTVVGRRYALGEALGTAGGLLMVLLFGFTGIPVIAEKLTTELLTGGPAICGPLKELGVNTAQILAGLVALRMLWSFTRAAGWAAVNGGRGIASALMEAGEAAIGLLFVSVAGPLAGHFLGLC